MNLSNIRLSGYMIPDSECYTVRPVLPPYTDIYVRRTDSLWIIKRNTSKLKNEDVRSSELESLRNGFLKSCFLHHGTIYEPNPLSVC
jgi:hypothetical protein